MVFDLHAVVIVGGCWVLLAGANAGAAAWWVLEPVVGNLVASTWSRGCTLPGLALQRAGVGNDRLFSLYGRDSRYQVRT